MGDDEEDVFRGEGLLGVDQVRVNRQSFGSIGGRRQVVIIRYVRAASVGEECAARDEASLLGGRAKDHSLRYFRCVKGQLSFRFVHEGEERDSYRISFLLRTMTCRCCVFRDGRVQLRRRVSGLTTIRQGFLYFVSG